MRAEVEVDSDGVGGGIPSCKLCSRDWDPMDVGEFRYYVGPWV